MPPYSEGAKGKGWKDESNTKLFCFVLKYIIQRFKSQKWLKSMINEITTVCYVTQKGNKCNSAKKTVEKASS